ncbi:MAG: hypothetical protein HWN81_21775 [Candidatus Lokiarchaeota archaeon]|nr:hypothetical protein [Candidatus Lokiarchaeota archaeon]
MRPSRVFRLIFRIFIFLLIISITLVSILGGLSAVLILTTPDTIGLDTDNADFDLQINNSTFEVEDFSFTLPFNLTNSGFFDLENLELLINLNLNYSHVDDPVPGVNTTRQVQIFTKYQNFGNIPKGTTGTFTFTGDLSNFNLGVLPNFTSEVDWYRGPPAIEFFADIIISLDYSIGLHTLRIGILDLQLGGLP